MFTVLECGLSSALGAGVDATHASLEEEKSALFRYETFIGSDFQPQLCAFRQKDRIGKLAYRLRELLHEATADLIARLAFRDEPLSALSGRGAKLILILPEVDESSGLDKASLAVVGRNLINDMSDSLSNRLGIVISETVIRAAGHAGVGSAVADCLMEPSKERDNVVLIAAVDSYNDRQRLNRLNDQRRLFNQQNQFGFIPGEAAGILLFRRETEVTPSLKVVGAGHRVEPVREYQEADSVFNALSEAAFVATDLAFSGRREMSISAWIADWNNSRYRATELSFAIHRLNSDCLKSDLLPVFPALQFGDVGAAYGCLAIALARSARTFSLTFGSEHTNADTGYEELFLVSAGSIVSGLRSAMVLSRG